GCRSEPADVLRLRALAALRDVELHPLVLLQAAEAGGRDGREVGEHVSAAVVGRDETEALVCVEPFHRTGGHVLSFSFTGLVRSPQTHGAPGSRPQAHRKASGNHNYYAREPSTVEARAGRKGALTARARVAML